MFCKKCGKEVEDTWNKCPYCGEELKESKTKEVLQPETMQDEANGQKKPKKVWKTIGGLVLTFVILWLLGQASSGLVSKLRGEHDPNDTYKLSTEATGQNGINLESMPNGFAGWKEKGFKGSVVTDITIPYPIKDTSKNNYAVYIGTGRTNVGIIMQKDEKDIADWEWLMNAQPDEDTQAYSFSCELTYSGQNAGDDEIPVFIISSPKNNFAPATEISVGETKAPNGIVNNKTASADTSSNKVDYGMIYGGIVDSISAEGTDPSQISYALYDIDKDGFLEFLIENSKLEYDVYTTDGKLSKYLGALSDATDLSLYDCKDGNGLYTNYCHMGYQVVKQVSIQNGALSERTIFEGENDYDSDNGKKFDELKSPIQMHTLQDKMTW